MTNEPAPPCATIRPARCLLWSIAAAVFLAGVLVSGTLLVDGKSQAARAATSLAMPLGLLWLLCCAGGTWFALRKQRWGGAFLFGLWLLIGVTCNGNVARWLVRWVEAEPAPLSADAFPLRAVVVLGGGVGLGVDGQPQLGRDGQRVISAAQMWHAGEVQAIVCTGTTPIDYPDPSALGRQVLVSIGIPNEVVFESPGENTSEELANLRMFLDNPPPTFPRQGPVGLITSAFHLKRAMRLAAANNVDVIAIPCCYSGASAESFSPSQLIPTAGGGEGFAKALKELLARLVGR